MTAKQTSESIPPSRPLWLRLVPLALLILISGVAYQLGWYEFFELENLLRERAAWSAFLNEHYLLGLLIYFGVVILFVALALPGASPLCVFGGLLLGKYVGGGIVLAGVAIGATLMFCVARTSLGNVLARRFGPRFERLREGFQRHALNYLLSLRLIPLFPFWLVTLASAFLGVPFRTFLVGTAVGIAPLVFVLTTFGEGLDEMLEEQQVRYENCVNQEGGAPDICDIEISLTSLFTPQLLGCLLVLALLALVPIVIRKFRREKQTRH